MVNRSDWLSEQFEQWWRRTPLGFSVRARDELIIHHWDYDYIYSNWWLTGERNVPDVSVVHNEAPTQLLSACEAHSKVSRKQKLYI